jgi:hypothetical protein
MSQLKTHRSSPAEIRRILLKHSMSDGRDCALEWTVDFSKMMILLYAPFISPSLLLDFIYRLPHLDERFTQTEITNPIQIASRFQIRLNVTHGESCVWYALNVFKLQTHSEKLDRLEIELIPA